MNLNTLNYLGIMSSFFVDEYKQIVIPPQEKWAELSFNELLDLRSSLLERQQCFSRNPELWKQMQNRLEIIASLIYEKSK